jgi:glycosyltransferase involved in cell wall biosynthesis
MEGVGMKIAMIGHKRIPSREGGVEIVVEELATKMVAQGDTVDVYNRMRLNGGDHQKYYKKVRIINIPTINVKKLDAVVYSFLATIRALFGSYDVIHFHGEGSAVMTFIPHFFGIKTVVTIHGLDWKRAKWHGFAKKYLKFGEKVAAKYSDEIIVLSKNVQKYFQQTYGRDTKYIPNGVELPQKREVNIIKKKYGLEKNNYFLFLARIVPEKGLHYLLKAYRKTNISKKLVIAGEPSHSFQYMERIKEMADKDPRVILVGFVQGEELKELYSNCSVYILPSDIEGMPISLLEAMSFERKCLISDIPENREVIGSQGIYFQKSNVESLRNALEKISGSESIGSSEKYDMSRFDWKKVTQENRKLYDSGSNEFLGGRKFV